MSARVLQAAQAGDALLALDWLLGWAGGWMPVERRRDGERPRLWWHHVGVPGSGALLARTVRGCDERYSDEIVLGLPQHREWAGGVTGATVLWCRVEGEKQLRRARAFRPLPSMVLQEGSSSRRWLLWALEERCGYFDLLPANRKIAYKLGAVQKHGSPDECWLPAPGTCLRVGRSRPVPIVVGRLTGATYTVRAVTGRLKEPPALDSWRESR